MYQVLIGFNTRLAPDETWDENNGGKVTPNGEVRFEKGENISALPRLAREGMLIEARAISVTGDAASIKKAGRKAVKNDETVR